MIEISNPVLPLCPCGSPANSPGTMLCVPCAKAKLAAEQMANVLGNSSELDVYDNIGAAL